MAQYRMLLPLLFLQLAAGILVVESRGKDPPKKMCSRDLMQTIAEVCSPKCTCKRSARKDSYGDAAENMNYISMPEESGDMKIKKRSVDMFETPGTRRRRDKNSHSNAALADYCCNVGCTKAEIRKYC